MTARTLHRGLCLALLLTLLGGARAWASPAAPDPGVPITNRATATYVDAATGTTLTLDSNEVQVLVQPLEALTLTQDQTVLRPAGAPVSLPHVLTNTGNVQTDYTLTLRNLAGDDYDLTGLQLVRDLNGNGQADAGEPVVATEGAAAAAPGTVTLARDAVANLVITGTVPVGTAAGASARLDLRAVSATQGASATNTDTVNVQAGPALTVVKTANPATAAPGDEVEYSVVVTNVGALPAAGDSVTVEGAAETLVVVQDEVPPNTTFVSATAVGGQVLYHAAGDPPGSWRTSLPAQVDGAACGLPSLAPGASATLRLRVRLNANASGQVQNTATVAWRDPTTGTPILQPSNPVTVPVTGVMPTIHYYTDDTWNQITGATHLGSPLFVQVDTAGCNLDPRAVETIEVTLTSTETGDVESFTATETGPNTGIYRIIPVVPTANGTAGPNPGNGVLDTVINDVIVARESCSGFQVAAQILVDPFGVVFDSQTDALIAGATVSIFDVTGNGNGGNPGGPATVFADDGVTPAPSVVVTGADGMFRFPLVPPSTYRILVSPPAGFGFPSSVPPGQLPPGRVIDPSGSYGGTFVVTQASNPIQIDIPVDGPPPSGLFIDKAANRQVVELGEFVEYTIQVSNGTGTAFTACTVADELPLGFSYVPGTARLNGTLIADPTGGVGPRLEFNLGPLAAGAKVTLVYRVRVNPGSGTGDRYNRAQAAAVSAAGTVLSNTASAKVKVEPGVFTDRGILFGKIFVDKNGNGEPDPDEPGIPGVRIFLEDGTFVLTDGEGKFNLYGLRARTHVARVDRTTLPAGAVLGAVSQRFGGDGFSRFVDLKSGELHRADFAEVSGSEAVLAEVERRRKERDVLEGARYLDQRLRPDAATPEGGDPQALPSSGLIGPAGPIPMEAAPPEGQAMDHRNSNLPREPVAPLPSLPADEAIAALSNETAFVDLKDGDTLATPQANVRVKGLAGTTLRLTVNGTALGPDRVGTKSTVQDKELQVWEYVGVAFQPGDNELVLEQVDGFGNVRETVKIQVKAPGEAGQIQVTVPEEPPQADGKTPVVVTVEVLDDQGLAVTARTPVTLEAEAGTWEVEDLNPREPGVQTFVTGGRTEFQLRPPLEPGKARVRATSGLLEGLARIDFTTEKRPLFAVGIVEGVVDFRSTRTGPVAPPEIGNLLEDELDRLARPDNATSRADARTAFYMKGHLGDGFVITMSYDSQKERELRLFRDIQPDEYYPIYGDSSVKGFDAQSTSPLYFRLDKDENNLLYGDYVTATPDPHQGLGTYYRSLTGGRLHLEGESHRVNLWGTKDRQEQVVQEIPANGTSGPYLLNFRFIRVNSERVEIIVRDRNQPSVVLSSESRSRFTDYVVDFQTGGILFRRPVPSLDAELNPIFVRVVYEVDGGGPSNWVYGGDARFRLTDVLSIGGTFARDEHPQDPYQLWSANLGLDFDENTRFTAEVAASDRLSLGSGTANRFEFVHQGNPISARLYTGHTDVTFDNPTSLLARGRTETGAKATWDVNEDTRLVGEFIRTKDNTTGGQLTGYTFGVEQKLAEGVSLEVAWRRALQKNGPFQATSLGAPSIDLSTLRARLNAQIPGVPEATMFAEYEQDLRDSSKRAVAVGGDYQFSDRGRVYARHEFLSTLGSRYTLNEVQRRNTTVVGVDTDYMEGGHVFSEYRIRDAIDGREAEAAIGLRNTFEIADGLRLNTTFERILSNSAFGGDSNAVTGALEYTGSEDFKATARLEYRNSGGTNFILRSAGLAWRATPDLSLLLRDVGDSADGPNGDRRFDRTQLGLAYRPVDGGPFNALLKVERRYEQDDLASRLRRNVALASITVNYQPTAGVNFSAYYAGKYARERSSGITSESTAHMVGGRLIWQLNERWDVGVQGAKLFGPDTGSDQHTLGVEFGYMLMQDTWVSAGYNFTGFTDRDLSVENYTSKGPYLRLRIKFGIDEFDPGTGTP